ncbi:GreA/GreB family elongation factor [Psychroflexus sp. CAK57W]|uniref:GreA/GreB family elongation factor n=1 Tax=Psychroflexus curvus TaxID=2873595 RepID=UPI001CC9B76A|nr:GreA/GreB family elongation factor [Psychroflexus curvus]MBZ9627612.1 GreA/GreB family elongation factor [Psychroflexus curvus]MBZ9786099.1 GreA/GreB family elongation factor [Psychroflexus curvus]
MSRGFVKESDQEEPIVVPPRASLPEKETNYVTPYGKNQLEKEKNTLEKQRTELDTKDETQRRRELSLIDGKLKLLSERLKTAQVIQPKDQNQSEVRFGAKVKFKMNGNVQEFQIVGVDEANVKEKKIAFISPLAKAMTSKKEGDKFEFHLGEESRPIEILGINY